MRLHTAGTTSISAVTGPPRRPGPSVQLLRRVAARGQDAGILRIVQESCSA